MSCVVDVWSRMKVGGSVSDRLAPSFGDTLRYACRASCASEFR